MESAIQPAKTVHLQRWGGAAFMLGNFLFIVNKLNEMSRLFLSRPMSDVISGQNPLMIIIGQAALVIGYVAFLRVYLPRAQKYSRIALRLFAIGGIVLAIGHLGFIQDFGMLIPPAVQSSLEALFLVILIALPVMLIGLIWLGILNLRRPLLTQWRWLPLATGLMGFIGFFLFSGSEITATFLAFRTLFALGLIGLGLVLWLEKPVPLETSAAN